MANKVLQDITFNDYSDTEIEYTIKTKNYSIEQLTDILKIKPTRGFGADESYVGQQHNTDTKQIEPITRQRPYTLWVFNTKFLTQSNRFEEHAYQLLNLLTPQIESIKKLITERDNFEIIIFIYLKFDREEDGFGFGSTSTILNQLADISHYIEWRTK